MGIGRDVPGECQSQRQITTCCFVTHSKARTRRCWYGVCSYWRSMGSPRWKAPAYRSRRFTVTELLVVIAVILLLAAFLLPSLAKAKERGRLTRCQSNLRQISLGLLQYADTIT